MTNVYFMIVALGIVIIFFFSNFKMQLNSLEEAHEEQKKETDSLFKSINNVSREFARVNRNIQELYNLAPKKELTPEETCENKIISANAIAMIDEVSKSNMSSFDKGIVMKFLHEYANIVRGAK